jgi:hypothetical protein
VSPGFDLLVLLYIRTIPVLHPYYTRIIPVLHPYYTRIIPVLHPPVHPPADSLEHPHLHPWDFADTGITHTRTRGFPYIRVLPNTYTRLKNRGGPRPCALHRGQLYIDCVPSDACT